MNDKVYDIIIVGQSYCGKILLSKLLTPAYAALNLKIALVDREKINYTTYKNNTKTPENRNFALRPYALDFLKHLNLPLTPINNLVNIVKKTPLIWQQNNISGMVLATNLHNQLIEYINANKNNNLDFFLQHNYLETMLTNTKENNAILIENNKEKLSLQGKIIIFALGKTYTENSMYKNNHLCHNYHQTSLVFNVKNKYPHNNTAYEVFLDYASVALLPTQNPRVYNVVLNVKNNLKNISKPQIINLLEHHFEGVLSQIEIMDRVLSYPLNLNFCKNLVHNNCILLGDSALKMHPIAGQALNSAIKNMMSFLDVFIENYKMGVDLNFTSNFKQYARLALAHNTCAALLTHGFAKIVEYGFLKFAMAKSFKYLDQFETLKGKIFNRLIT